MNKQIINTLINQTVTILGDVEIKSKQCPMMQKVFENLMLIQEQINTGDGDNDASDNN